MDSSPSKRPRSLATGCLGLAVALVVSSCASEGAPETEATQLVNGGKDDSAAVTFRLTESNAAVGMLIRCEGDAGCDGVVEVSLRAPDPCEVLGVPGCGVGPIAATAVELATVRLQSNTEGLRELPFRVHTEDGDFISTTVTVAFTATPGEEIAIDMLRAPGAPDATVMVEATWEDAVDPGARELIEYLATVEGLSFEETATGYPGYRAYTLSFEQPLDHFAADSETFVQTAVLHHRGRRAPMVLYTSGYQLFYADYLSEISESFGTNQLNTEQRFFGSSAPASLDPEDWEFVTIAQAAADHHRLVEALRPFYDGSWLSTGHSKGGMTSVYHRRFYPEDVQATVAYVAPISFEPFDPRYPPFLDQIGGDTCREGIRAMQRLFLERFDDLLDVALGGVPDSGQQAQAIEGSIVGIEWPFWQSKGVLQCDEVPTLPELAVMDEYQLWDELTYWTYGDQSRSEDLSIGTDRGTYNYQAARELGHPAMAQAHLVDLLQHDPTPWWVPTEEPPVHDPSAMRDIQDWVLDHGTEILFIYGEHDPWTGGAFSVPDLDGVTKVVAPAANHGAMIGSLGDDDRTEAVEAIERWIGTGPTPTVDAGFSPMRAQHPPRLMLEAAY